MDIAPTHWVNGSAEHAELLRRRTTETLKEISSSLGEETAEGALARGKMFEMVGYFFEAIKAYSDALGLDPSIDEARARLALSQLKASRFESGLHTITELAARRPDYTFQALTTDEKVSAMTVLGDALVATGRPDDAQTAFEEARRINDQDSYAAARLAQVRIVNNETSQALELRESFADNPRFAGLSAGFNLAETNVKLVPRLTERNLTANLIYQMPGRPVVVEGELRLAPVVEGDDRWCGR
jgi:tetratricopeptide (TPR) repeat protein